MSPEYPSINNTPSKIKEIAKTALEEHGLDYAHAVQVGFALCIPNGHVTKVDILKNLSEGVISAGKKQDSPWHIVKGLSQPYLHGQKMPRYKEGDVTYGEKKHRGKHRSTTKGTGLHAFFYSMMSTRSGTKKAR